MTHKTKATTKGSPVEIKEIKCITNYAMSVAGGQGYQSGGRFLPDLSRRGYFSTKSSRAKRFCGCFFTPGRGVNSSGSDISLARFSSSWRSSMRCKSRLRCSAKISVVDLYFLVMVLSCKAICRTASHYGTNGFYSFHGVEALKSGHYLFLGEINRRGYLSRNASSANRFGLVRGEGLSKDSRSRRTFSRWRSSMDNAISCNSSFVIVCTRKAVRCSTSYHSTGIFYGCNLRDDSGRFATYCININNVMLLCAFKENAGIFRTNFSRNTSDHLSKKAAYTEAIPYKTGIGITTPQELEAIHDAPASFFVSAHTHTSTMVGCMGPTSVGLVSSNASCGNPVQSTASELTTSGGGYNPKVRGAFHMAVSARPYFVWRFMQCLTDSIAIFTVTAATEREARARLPHAHLIFVARIRQEVTHA
ncbi:host cell division inhibitor Icd-like protein [Escherichia coli]|nr:host cell division inhibitor Icd-like protein [Escherichia coli]EER4740452.1 host cell division inhibitor Icd-like protein [Escherichia coli]EEU9721757.1 host cell division inhibitor Icd-like protein [Escherichia coli]EEV5630074.1 host cell division inhibitor Icd-like protein [Escherichia coli]EFC1315597.1 host cell division inhibitor Icd-like protein [Escherichia coli]